MSRVVAAMLVCLLAGTAMQGCSAIEKALDLDDDETAGPAEDTGVSEVDPADPPYTSRVTYPSGLHLDGLVRDAELSGTYPDPSANSFGSGRTRHYERVGYFIDIASLSSAVRQERVTPNFKLNEYVVIPERNGDRRAYIDAQISLHAQELRDAWGGPLVLSSSFRSPEYNARIGAATFSRHMYGDAVDIKANSTSMAQDLYNLARYLEVSYLEPADLTIAGKSTPWIHMDDRGWPVNTPETR